MQDYLISSKVFLLKCQPAWRHSVVENCIGQIPPTRHRLRHLLVRAVRRDNSALPVHAGQRISSDGAGLKLGGIRPAGIPVGDPVHTAERVGDAVPPQVLPQRQPRRFYHVYDRRRAESGRREQYPPGDEKRQGAGQLPQFIYVLAERHERRHSDHPAVRGGSQR